MKQQTLQKAALVAAMIFIVATGQSAAIALLIGAVLGLWGNPWVSFTRKAAPKSLQYSIVGLGAGMDLAVVGKVGAHGVGYTATTILFTMIAGTLLGRLLGVLGDTSLLITVGTAICGGSAIAAVGAAIRARGEEMSVALATVFILNALALFIFPGIGHHFNLDQTQFGLWSALAVHDTSSVVGTSLQYGPQALEIGTTVKLARALWIIPLTFAVFFARRRSGKADAGPSSLKIPWFILGFVVAAALVTWIPALKPAGLIIADLARRLLVLSLFFIGANLTRETIKAVGMKPFLQGFTLWIIVGITTLAAISTGWIHL